VRNKGGRIASPRLVFLRSYKRSTAMSDWDIQSAIFWGHHRRLPIRVAHNHVPPLGAILPNGPFVCFDLDLLGSILLVNVMFSPTLSFSLVFSPPFYACEWLCEGERSLRMDIDLLLLGPSQLTWMPLSDGCFNLKYRATSFSRACCAGTWNQTHSLESRPWLRAGEYSACPCWSWDFEAPVTASWRPVPAVGKLSVR